MGVGPQRGKRRPTEVRTLFLLLILQAPIERHILEVEDGRLEDVSVLLDAVRGPLPRIQRLAARALGRLERPEHAPALLPLLSSPDGGVRREAVNALGQIGAQVELRPFLEKEGDAEVRGALYQTLGRLPQADESLLRAGLREAGLPARIGAAKGLEVFFRRTKTAPSRDTVEALQSAIRENASPVLRELALLTLSAAGEADPETLRIALQDPEPQVRRLAVMGLKQWKDDPSFMVRYESLRVAGNCERAEAALGDPSDHLALAAVDFLGQLGRGCTPSALTRLVDEGGDWRQQARALVSLAKTSPEAARARLGRFVAHEKFQARAYAAQAAKLLRDEPGRQRLLRDPNPNVMAAALATPEEAIPALESNDYGLLMEAGERLKGFTEGRRAVPALLAALKRVSAERRATSRDPRRVILERLAELGDRKLAAEIRPLLSDFDPFIAALAARVISEKTGESVMPQTVRFAPTPLPDESFLRKLAGARARIKMREAGAFTIELLPQEAPLTVAAFARLAEQGY